MKWIKGILLFGMVVFAHSSISMNDIDARNKNQSTATSKKSLKKDTPKAQKKGGFFSSLKGKFASFGAKIKSGAAALKDKASNSVNCRAGKGEDAGKKLYAMASGGQKLTDNHVVAAHASSKKKLGRNN